MNTSNPSLSVLCTLALRVVSIVFHRVMPASIESHPGPWPPLQAELWLDPQQGQLRFFGSRRSFRGSYTEIPPAFDSRLSRVIPTRNKWHDPLRKLSKKSCAQSRSLSLSHCHTTDQASHPVSTSSNLFPKFHTISSALVNTVRLDLKKQDLGVRILQKGHCECRKDSHIDCFIMFLEDHAIVHC